MRKVKQVPAKIIVLLTLIIGGWYLFSESMNTYPAYVHAWTQSDRLALAENFQSNGFDFFHPATYNLLTKDGITQVDFPVHDYLVAIVSEVLSTDLVSTFRWYTLLYSLIGLFFFSKLLLLFTQSAPRSVLGTAFLFTLPFYVYYQNGFLPSAPSFANFLIGIYLVFKSRKSHENKLHLLGVLFLTLAALARAPFLIFLFALFLLQLWQGIRQKKWEVIKLITQLIGISLFVVYFFYNKYLGSIYGSMFLSEALYFTDFSNFIEVLKMASDRWGNQLLSSYHAILFSILLIAGILQLNKRGSFIRKNVPLVQYLLISSVGVLLFFFAFGRQFADHDYYYIDSFLPLLALLIVYLLSSVRIPSKWYEYVGSVCIIFFFYFFSYAGKIQKERYTPPYNDRVEYAYSVYERAKDDLKAWGVQPEDTLYVLEANSTNIPFTVFKNRGYTNLSSRKEVVERDLDSTFTYAVLIDSFFVESSFRAYPGIIKQFEKLNSNGELSLYRRNKTQNPALFFDALVEYAYSDFDGNDNLSESVMVNTSLKSIDSLHGNSLLITEEKQYSLTIRDSLKNINPEKDLRVQVVGEFYQTDSTRMQVVFQVNDYYGARYTISELKKLNEWEKVQFSYKIPSTYFKPGDPIVFYFWNPNKSELVVDNLNLIIYQ